MKPGLVARPSLILVGGGHRMADILAPLVVVLVHPCLRRLHKVHVLSVHVAHAPVLHHPGHHPLVVGAVAEVGEALRGVGSSHISALAGHRLGVASRMRHLGVAPPRALGLVVARRRRVSPVVVVVRRAVVGAVARANFLVAIVVFVGLVEWP